MKLFCQIRSIENNPMSTFKPATPKMLSAMKELCERYEKMFGIKYFVHRFIPTQKGMKKI